MANMAVFKLILYFFILSFLEKFPVLTFFKLFYELVVSI